ncbi:MAG: ECF-type sigma factor [Fuerstiella sp.]|nr:sigma-70 family RNA polymerase sigma factor [Fuerstiella sp.]
MYDVTQILSKIEQGDDSAAEQLLPLVYEELRHLAAVRLAKEKPGQTLQATSLVHEAYVRLTRTDDVPRWKSRGHFFAAAAEAIRRILIEQARRKAGPKAGGDRQRLGLSEIHVATAGTDFELLDLDEALVRLEAEDPRAANEVKLRFFAGLTREEAAQALGVSVSTADNDWAYAKGWLQVQLAGATEASL